ncbi:hypothetical protein NKG05_23540 [Oerskovia sp. M15]
MPWLDAVRLGGLLLVAALSGLLWQVVSGWSRAARRLSPDAGGLAGTGPVVPFLPWVQVSQVLFGNLGPWLLVLVLAAVVALGTSPVARRLGPELQAWPLAYLGYLVVVIEPWTSLVRFLLLAFPSRPSRSAGPGRGGGSGHAWQPRSRGRCGGSGACGGSRRRAAGRRSAGPSRSAHLPRRRVARVN